MGHSKVYLRWWDGSADDHVRMTVGVGFGAYSEALIISNVECFLFWLICCEHLILAGIRYHAGETSLAKEMTVAWAVLLGLGVLQSPLMRYHF